WGSLAYSQAAFLPALQVAALLGVAGVLFLVALFPAALALAYTYGRRLHRPAWAYGTAASLVVVALAYGTVRLRTASIGPETIFGLAAIDDYLEPNEVGPKPAAVWQQYAQHVATLAGRGAQVVVLPEKIGEYSPQQAVAIQQRLAGLARQHRIWLEAGIGLQDGKEKRNMLWLFTPQGALSVAYQKHHLAPPERTFAVGHAFEVRPVAGATYGMAICKDMHFAPLGRAYGQRQAAVMLVPAWDFTTDAQMALNITAARGVENGYLIVRPSRQGFLTVSDAYGRVLHQVVSQPLPGATLLARVPVPAPQATFFTRSGQVFGWLCVAAATGLLLLGRRKPQPAPVPEMTVSLA
ncbi:MAG: carbon-nitrogen hydrolase family protein, partial [Hymenobacter sp.]|nr:carbon-nitrogen hydrolase family protein [Hymenobacter sp.]